MKKTKIKKIIIWVVILSVAAGLIYKFTHKKKDDAGYVFANVSKSDIKQTVSETGTVKSENEINLGFLGSGKLKKKNYKIGDKVKVGDIIAELDYSSLEISKKQAQSNLDSANDSLKKLLAGATAEDRAVAVAGLNQAKASYESAKKELERTKSVVAQNISQAQNNLNKIEGKNGSPTALRQAVVLAETNLNNAKTSYQKAIDDNRDGVLVTSEDKMVVAHTALDILDGILSDDAIDDLIGIKDKGSYDKTKSLYNDSISLLAIAGRDINLAKANTTNENILTAIKSSLNLQNKTFETLKQGYYALENSITSSGFTQSRLDSLKASVSAQQTLVSAAISVSQSSKHTFENAVITYNTNISAAQQSLSQAQASLNDATRSAYDALASAKTLGDQQITSAESRVGTAMEAQRVAKTQLDKILAPAEKYDIALAQSKITQAESSVKSIEKQIDDSIIKAPIGGTITKFGLEIGEQVSPGVSVVSMLGENNFEIEVLISEADIAKINKDDAVDITLDSFGEDVKFVGKVIFIEPAETEIQDVVYYKVKIKFEPGAVAVKSGMTANVVITTDARTGVLTIPSRAVIDKNGQGKFIRVLDAGKNVVEKKIEVGLRGDEGLVEVLSGVVEGEQLITYIKGEK